RKQSTTIYLEKKKDKTPELSVTVTYDYSPAYLGSREDPPEDEEIEITDIKLEGGTLANLIFFLGGTDAFDLLTKK
ncbi:hypothetical protein ACI3PL_31835, partial [Lacticaseibacillus paracasei]